MQEAQQYVPMTETVNDIYVPAIGKTVKVMKARAHVIQFSGR